jgi:MraZ protein
MRLQGRFNVKMDSKGRVAIPSALREQLGDKSEKPLIVTNSDTCLELFPSHEWDLFLQKNDQLAEKDPDVELFQAYYVSAAQEVTLDKAFRILIPASLREEAGLKNDVTIIGMGIKIQIYDLTVWKSVSEEAKRRFKEIRSKLAGDLKK